MFAQKFPMRKMWVFAEFVAQWRRRSMWTCGQSARTTRFICNLGRSRFSISFTFLTKSNEQRVQPYNYKKKTQCGNGSFVQCVNDLNRFNYTLAPHRGNGMCFVRIAWNWRTFPIAYHVPATAASSIVLGENWRTEIASSMVRSARWMTFNSIIEFHGSYAPLLFVAAEVHSKRCHIRHEQFSNVNYIKWCQSNHFNHSIPFVNRMRCLPVLASIRYECVRWIPFFFCHSQSACGFRHANMPLYG